MTSGIISNISSANTDLSRNLFLPPRIERFSLFKNMPIQKMKMLSLLVYLPYHMPNPYAVFNGTHFFSYNNSE